LLVDQTRGLNACIYYLPGEGHLVFNDNLLQQLKDDELLLTLAHKLPSISVIGRTAKAAALGLEPVAPFSQVIDVVTGRKIARPANTHQGTHDPDLQLLVAHWYDLPTSLRRQIVKLSRSWPQEDRP